jgi:hypothetical protein
LPEPQFTTVRADTSIAGQEKHIIVNISKTAEVKIEAFGYVGGACQVPIQKISEVLGVVTLAEPKPEFFASQEVQALAG